MKKILYVISSLESSGPVKILYNIACHIDKKKYDVYVLALSPARRNDLQLDFESLGVNVHTLNISRSMMFIQGKNILYHIIEDIKPDIVHTQCFRSTIFMQYFAKKVALCTTIHCIFYQNFLFSYGSFIGWMMIQMYAKALKKYDICVACSETVRRGISSRYKLNITHVRNGIKVPVIKHVSEQLSLIQHRNELGLAGYEKIFICTGTICYGKNQAQILRCLKKMNNICVVFLGDGPDFEILKKESQKNAIFLGNVNNVYEYLAVADGFVSASLSEGMPNAVLEALMMGLPCILSNIEAHCEIKNAYPDACFLYDSDDDKDLLACFYKVISMKISYESISHASKKLFSSDVMSSEYQDIYARL